MLKKIVMMGTALIMCLGFFSGCTSKPKNFCAQAMFSKNILELPILGVQDAPGHYYSVELNIDEIFSKISEDESLSTTFIDDKIFIVKDNNDGTRDYFIIREDYGVGRNGYYYRFFDMGGQVKLNNDFGNRILIPYHLITENLDTFIEMNTEYSTKFDIDDFFNFYSDSGWYDVEKGEDYFIIKGYVDEEKVMELNNTLMYPLRYMDFTLSIKFQFMSSEESDINFFVISYL